MNSKHVGSVDATTRSRLQVVRTDASLTEVATARWENEGGAAAGTDDDAPTRGNGQSSLCLTNAELAQLQVRVIALENLVTALLAGAPEGVVGLARELAASILPRAGCTPHHLTIRAASQMIHLAQRAELFRTMGFQRL